MTVLQLKNDLHQMVDQIENVDILAIVHNILTQQLANGLVEWNSLSKVEQDAIEQAIEQLDKGEGIAHEEVMKKYFAKYQL